MYELGNMSNECLKRRLINMTEYKEEDDVLIKTEPEGSDFDQEHGEPIACVV